MSNAVFVGVESYTARRATRRTLAVLRAVRMRIGDQQTHHVEQKLRESLAADENIQAQHSAFFSRSCSRLCAGRRASCACAAPRRLARSKLYIRVLSYVSSRKGGELSPAVSVLVFLTTIDINTGAVTSERESLRSQFWP